MMRVSVFVEFARDDDVQRFVVRFLEFIDEMVTQFFVVQVRLSISKKNVFVTDAEVVLRHVGNLTPVNGGIILPTIGGRGQPYIYKNGAAPPQSVIIRSMRD